MLATLIHHYLLPVLFMTGLIAGTIDAIAGGGGLICIPMLLGVGIPPHLTLGTNKFQSLFGTAVATFSYYRKGWLNHRDLWCGLAFSLCGAILGALASEILSTGILKKIIPILLFLVLIYTLFSPKLGDKDTMPKMSENLFYAVFGTLLGFYDGFLGPGTGSFWVFLLIYFLGFRLTKATAYTKAFNLNTNITAAICFALGNNIDYRIAICMAAGQIIGGKLGAALAINNGAEFIRPVFLIMVVVTMATLIYRNYADTNNYVILLTTAAVLAAVAFSWTMKKQKV